MRKKVLCLCMVMIFGLSLSLFLGATVVDQGEDETFYKKMFLANELYLQDTGGVYLKRGLNCYTLMSNIDSENAEKYHIDSIDGLGSGATVYWHLGTSTIVTTDDFDPMEINPGEKIISYGGEIEFLPVEFEQYTYCGVISANGLILNYWSFEDCYDKMAFPTDALITHNADNNRSIAYEDIEKGREYILKWHDLYGYHELAMPPANCRLYRAKVSAEGIALKGEEKDGYIVYDTAKLPAGTYSIITEHNRGGLITIKTR